jgi:hypothetical protein
MPACRSTSSIRFVAATRVIDVIDASAASARLDDKSMSIMLLKVNIS